MRSDRLKGMVFTSRVQTASSLKGTFFYITRVRLSKDVNVLVCFTSRVQTARSLKGTVFFTSRVFDFPKTW